jgi:hypothetical protein
MLSASGRDVADAIARTFRNREQCTITGLIPFTAMARFTASNVCVEPTEMPCTLARRANISPELSLVVGDLC